MRLIIFLIAIGLSGCALFRDLDKMAETQRKVCNYDGAFAEGLQDAKSGVAMNSDRIKITCDAPREEEALRGYRDGYMTGTKSKQ